MKVKYKDSKNKYVCIKDYSYGYTTISKNEHLILKKKIKTTYLQTIGTCKKITPKKSEFTKHFIKQQDDFEYDSQFDDGMHILFMIMNLIAVFFLYIISLFNINVTQNININFSWFNIINVISIILILEILHFWRIKRIQKKLIIIKINIIDIIESKVFHFFPAILIFIIIKNLYLGMKKVFILINNILVYMFELLVYMFELLIEYYIQLLIILSIIMVIILVIYIFMKINLYLTEKFINRGKNDR